MTKPECFLYRSSERCSSAAYKGQSNVTHAALLSMVVFIFFFLVQPYLNKIKLQD